MELGRSKEAVMNMQDMEGYKELMDKMLETLPAEQRLAGLPAEQRRPARRAGALALRSRATPRGPGPRSPGACLAS
jgi:hypothetical protein